MSGAAAGPPRRRLLHLTQARRRRLLDTAHQDGPVRRLGGERVSPAAESPRRRLARRREEATTCAREEVNQGEQPEWLERQGATNLLGSCSAPTAAAPGEGRLGN